MRRTTVLWMTLTAGLAGALSMATVGLALALVVLRPAEVSAGPTIDPVVLVGQVRALSRLETAQVDLVTTVHGSRGTGWVASTVGEQLRFQGVGVAHCGVDLGRLEADDLWVEEGVVWIRLPQAEVFEVALDVDRSSVLTREVGWFGRADADLETHARRAAARQLEAQAAVLGLEEAASVQAQVVIGDLLRGLGAEEVRFVVEDNPPLL